jgi:MraZ protein
LSFRGTFEHALDAKHRLTVPAKFRAALAAGVVLAASHEATPGSPRCVSIWTPESYDAFTAETLNGLNPVSPKARELKRFFFNSSFDAELDSANRLMIPPPLMRRHRLGRVHRGVGPERLRRLSRGHSHPYPRHRSEPWPHCLT